MSFIIEAENMLKCIFENVCQIRKKHYKKMVLVFVKIF